MALLFDLHARHSSNNTSSLDDVMRTLWVRFGKEGKGYTLSDIEQVCHEISEQSTNLLFEHYIKGTEDTQPLLEELLLKFGLKLLFKDRDNPLERMLGIQMMETAEEYRIISIAPGATGEQYFSPGDIISNVNEDPIKEWLESPKAPNRVKLTLKRKHVEKIIEVPLDIAVSYLKLPVVNKVTNPTPEQQEALRLWLGD